jgi:hypothetical protein
MPKKEYAKGTQSTYGKITNNFLSRDLNLYITSIFLKEAKIANLESETGWPKRE